MKRISLVAALLGSLVLALAGAAMAGNGNGAVITNTAAVNIPGQTGYNFIFWNGNGVQEPFNPTYYQEVSTPSGVHNEVLKGKVANDTGAPVVYTAFSGDPIPSGQGCWDFATGKTSTDWQLTIEASGDYTLTCHFPAAS